jgi:hypothetical protein
VQPFGHDSLKKHALALNHSRGKSSRAYQNDELIEAQPEFLNLSKDATFGYA